MKEFSDDQLELLEELLDSYSLATLRGMIAKEIEDRSLGRRKRAIREMKERKARQSYVPM